MVKIEDALARSTSDPPTYQGAEYQKRYEELVQELKQTFPNVCDDWLYQICVEAYLKGDLKEEEDAQARSTSDNAEPRWHTEIKEEAPPEKK